MSKTTTKRRLHESKYRGFTIRCKSLVRVKNRKVKLKSARKT